MSYIIIVLLCHKTGPNFEEKKIVDNINFD